ncbi:MAG: amino acid adenylation domain-containing protein, partial [bacterium]|nr:amino acid adenylation domain-containing protein [bacterium]
AERFVKHKLQTTNQKQKTIKDKKNAIRENTSSIQYYRTGDLARWLPDYNIEYLGRIDQQVKIRGFRIELGEIESSMLSHPGIKEAVVLARQSKNSDKFLCAYYVEAPQQPTSSPQPSSGTKYPSGIQHPASSIQSYLSKLLPEYMIPAYFIKQEKIPLTPNGKIDRKTLTQLPVTNIQAPTHIAPRNKIDEKLSEIWREILGEQTQEISIDDNFFDIGGHSLKATIMASKIHREFNVKLPLAEIFKKNSIRTLSDTIKEFKKEKYYSLEPIEKKDYYPLSSAQKRMYFLQQMDLNSTAYNMPLILPLSPVTPVTVTRQRLQDTFRELIRRHESFRTSFELSGEAPVQRIFDTVEFDVEYYEHPGQTETEIETSGNTRGGLKTVERIVKNFVKPFDLRRAPLLRSVLINRAGSDFILLVDMHHIISDGTSHMLLRDDFFKMYNGKQLEPLQLQYKEFSEWQNKRVETGEIKAREDYWLELYRGEIPRLDLFTDNKRPEVFTNTGAGYRFKIEPEETAGFKALAAARGGTLYMNLLAILNTLFFKYTGQTDIIIGSGVAGRPHAELQNIVGMFVNTLAMRNYPEGNKEYRTFFSEVIDGTIKAFQNQEVQFEELVDKLEVQRAPSRNPLFDISMVVQNLRGMEETGLLEKTDETAGTGNGIPSKEEHHTPQAGTTENRLALELVTTSRFDMTFFIYETVDAIHLNIEYYTAIFKHAAIRRLTNHLTNIVKAVIKNPEIKLDEIEIISEKEKLQLLYEFNDTTVKNPPDKTIQQLFEEQVERKPDSIAAVGPVDSMQLAVAKKQELLQMVASPVLLPTTYRLPPTTSIIQITYSQLNWEADRLALYLHEVKKLKPGEPVGVFMTRTLNYIPAILGILKAGGMYLPLEPTLPAERLKLMINDTQTGILISEKKHIRHLNHMQWECENFHSYLCIDTYDVYSEETGELKGKETTKAQLMSPDLWNHVAETANDEITGGGWMSSYTGLYFSREEMDEYGDNVYTKLAPLLNEKMRVLEIGTASGITMNRIAPKVDLYYGTDLSNTMIEKNKRRVKQENLQNIKLFCLAAHEIDQIEKDNPGSFDLIIINSVIQCFPGHNYLRKVMEKAIRQLGEKGTIFVGDIMDLQEKETLLKDLDEFKRANENKEYATKTDFSAELFVHRQYWNDLKWELQGIDTVESTQKIYTIKNELTQFRYDTILNIDKKVIRSPLPIPPHSAGEEVAPQLKKFKYQDDLKELPGIKTKPDCELKENRHTTGINLKKTPTAPAYVIYTSGSTGKPKGVLVEHRNVVRLVKESGYIDYTGEERLLLTGAFSFDVTTFEIWGPLLNGETLVMAEKNEILEAEKLESLVKKNKISILHLIPQLFNQMALQKPGIFAGLKYLLVGGDLVGPHYLNQVRERDRNLKILHMYGPTENTTFSTYFPVRENYETRIPIGKPLPNSSIYILDQQSHLVPVGVSGEIWVGGAGVARGYLNEPELTVERFIKSGQKNSPEPCLIKPARDGQKGLCTPEAPFTDWIYYKTGDLGRWRPGGNVEFLGRIDRQVKIRGYRIELEEVENRLLTHPGVDEAAVLSRKFKSSADAGMVEEDNLLYAYYTTAGKKTDASAGEKITDDAILNNYLSQTLPDYMIPSFFIKMEKIPLTPNGKIDRKALLRFQTPDNKTKKSYTPPRHKKDEKLEKIWMDILGTQKGEIGIDDDFFRVGGHSLKATVMGARIHKEFNIKLPLAEIFKNSSIRKIADALTGLAQKKYFTVETVEKKEHYGLSSAQKRMYILQQMELGGTAYNMPMIIPLPEEADPVKLEKIFKTLIRRHESLRTSFHMIPVPVTPAGAGPVTPNNQSPITNSQLSPVQVIHDGVEFKMERYKTVAGGTRTQEWQTFFRHFDLSRAPLLRVGIFETGKKRKTMLLDIHHIITDGTSQEVLTGEFFALYAGESLPPLRIQYKDYAEWQNRNQQKKLMKQQEEFWLKTIAGERPVLTLPTDYPRPAIQGFEGNNISFELNKEETGNIKETAKQNDTTLYMTIQAIFTILLSKLSGQEDIIIGTPTAGRRHADLENIIGMFVNTLPMRNQPEGEKTVKEYLREVKENTVQAFENQEYQFEDLVDRLSVRRDTGRNPIFDVMFNLFNHAEYKNNGAASSNSFNTPNSNNSSNSFNTLETTAKFDLTLNVFNTHDSLNINYEYSTKLFKEETINRFITYFNVILKAISNAPAQKIGEIEIITGEEKKQILYEFNDTAADYPKEKTIHQLFKEQVEKTPDRISTVGNTKRVPHSTAYRLPPTASLIQLTYRELSDKTHRLAGFLKSKGAELGKIVAIMVERSIEMIIGMLGILEAGGAYLPIDPLSPADRINYMLADSHTKILLCGVGKTLEQGQNTEKWSKKGIKIIAISELTKEKGQETGEKYRRREPCVDPSPRQSSSTLAYIIYTSGTTGKPKGVMIEHRSIVNTLTWRKKYYKFGEKEIVLQMASYSFDSSVEDIFTALLSGSRLITVPHDKRLNLEYLEKTILREAVSHILLVPNLYQTILNEIPDSLKGLDFITVAGDGFTGKLVKNHFEKLEKVKLFNEYGPTENSVCSTVYEFTRDRDRILIGKPINNVSCLITDKNRQLVPVGVAGELSLSGASLSRGYLNNQELTAERFANYKLQAANYQQITKNKIQITNKENEPEKGEQLQLPGTALQIKAFGSPEPFQVTADYCLLSGHGNAEQNAVTSVSKRGIVEASCGCFSRKGFWPPEARLYRTGDLTRWLPNGNIEFLGRIDHQVKIRGFRIELGEIENSLLAHPEIKEAVVLARESKNGDKLLYAYYAAENVPHPTPTTSTIRHPLSGIQSPSAIRTHLAQFLPDYMIPAYFIKLDKIPVTSNGKLDRKALSQYQISENQYPTHTAPRNAGEKKLTGIWAKILQHRENNIGIDDNFFEIGGHSLRATILVSKIHKEFNVKLPLTEIFKNFSIRTLFKTIKENTKDKYISIEAAEKKEYYSISSAQKRLYILQQMEQGNTAYNMPYVIPLAKETEPARLEETFKKLIRRHESLRTSIQMLPATPNNQSPITGNQYSPNNQSPITDNTFHPVQVVHNTVEFKIENIKQSAGNRDSSAGEPVKLKKIIDAFFRPFELSRAPLLRVAIVDTVTGRFMMVDMHHIITDGASQEVLTKEFFAIYDGESLPKLRLQYRDYAEWQNRSKQKEVMEQQGKYWEKILAGELPVLNLPTDYPRPVIQSFEGSNITFEIKKEETGKVKETAKKNGTTL